MRERQTVGEGGSRVCYGVCRRFMRGRRARGKGSENERGRGRESQSPRVTLSGGV